MTLTTAMPAALNLSTAGTRALGSEGLNTRASGLLLSTSSTRAICSGTLFSVLGTKCRLLSPSLPAMASLPTRTPRTIGLDWPLVRVAMVSAPACETQRPLRIVITAATPAAWYFIVLLPVDDDRTFLGHP